MKKHPILLCTLILFFAVSCNKTNEIYYVDYPSSYIEFYVTDQNGNNLIDPDFSGNILNMNITMEYNNEIYARINNDEEFSYGDETLTKASYHPFNGLMTNTENKTLKIGYFSQSDDYKQASFTIDWGNGTKDVITLDQESEPYDPDTGDLYANCQYWLNGKSIGESKPFEEGPHFTIVLESM